jgi:ribosomal protein S18 acetylase RimI-like enzyme
VAANDSEPITVVSAKSPSDFAAVRELFTEYAAWLGDACGVCGAVTEIESLPGDYSPPKGALLLALYHGEPAGCVALRPLGASVVEVKRLYVRPAYRGKGIARALMVQVLQSAGKADYELIRLDSLTGKMPAAVALYRSLGFREIDAYYDAGIAEKMFFEFAVPPKGD